MTRTKFCAIQRKRGYEVRNVGLITFLRHTDKNGAEYTAMWFWNEDGTLDQTQNPWWELRSPCRKP